LHGPIAHYYHSGLSFATVLVIFIFNLIVVIAGSLVFKFYVKPRLAKVIGVGKAASKGASQLWASLLTKHTSALDTVADDGGADQVQAATD